MQLDLVRRETLVQAGRAKTASEILVRYELMDGCPSKDETIPFRLHLSPLPVGPTLISVHNMLSVGYHLSLVLVDEDGRRYFKQLDIDLYRGPPPQHSEGADVDD